MRQLEQLWQVIDETERSLHKYRSYGDIAALRVARSALESAIADFDAALEMGRLHNQLSRVLRDLAEHDRAVADLDAAVHHGQTAVGRAVPDDPDLPVFLNNLGQAFGDRYEYTSSIEDLDSAEAHYRHALAIPHNPAAYGIIASGLASIIRLRFAATGRRDHLAEAVELGRRAADTTSFRDPSVLDELANALVHWSEETNDAACLVEAEAAATTAVHLATDRKRRAFYLVSLADIRYAISRRTGRVDLLDAALTSLDEALASTDALVVRGSWLNSAGNVLAEKFRRTGDTGYLREAVDRYVESLALTGPSDAHRPGRLTNVALAMRNLFHSEGTASAVLAAVEHARAAVSESRGRGAFHWTYLVNLGSMLSSLVDTLVGGPAQDARGESVAVLRQALAYAPLDAAERGVAIINLATGLVEQSKALRQGDLLDEAEQICREWLEAHGTGHVLRRSVEGMLGRVLVERVVHGGQPEYAGEAEQLLRALVEQLPEGDAVHTACLSNLAWMARTRVDLGHRGANRGDALSLAGAVARSPHVSTARRLAARLAMAELLTDVAAKAAAYRAVVDAMADIAPRSWHWVDREYGMSRFATAVSDAAACAIDAGDLEGAVDLLERGRGLLREPRHAAVELEVLRTTRPDLFERYEEVETRLAELTVATGQHFPSPDTAGAVAQGIAFRQRLHRVEEQLLTEIRAIPELACFRRPPTWRELRGHLPGPVVIVNTSTYRSDAVVADSGTLRLIPLPKASHLDMAWHSASFLHALRLIGSDEQYTSPAVLAEPVRNALTWLWHQVARPVLPALNGARRVWWCPIGALAFFPFHAAGPYRSGTDEAVIDHVISSYTPSLRALARARHDDDGSAEPSVLAVGLPFTPEAPALPGAAKEARMVAGRFRRSTTLIDADATRIALLRGLAEHSWFHFAGHSVQDTIDATEAWLMTHDAATTGGVSATDIGRIRATGSHLAFLSSCQSAAGKITLPNEGAHIAGAFLAAGFRHVIASNWPVGDALAAKAAKTFYRTTFTTSAGSDGVAEALHAALRSQRDQIVRSDDPGTRLLGPLLWASLTHFGA